MLTRRAFCAGLVGWPLVASARLRRPASWLFLGDSVTAAPDSYAQLFKARLKGAEPVAVGAQSGFGAFELRSALEGWLQEYKPDVVSVMIGLNDCLAGPSAQDMTTYKFNMKVLLDGLKGRTVVLQTPNPIDVARHPKRSALPAYVRYLKQAAKARGLVLVDHWPYWQQHQGVKHWLKDGLHPNDRGHAALLAVFTRTLGL